MRVSARFFPSFLAVVYAASNVVFVHAAEGRFWEERRRAAKTAGASSSALLAQLPAAAPWSVRVPGAFPAAPKTAAASLPGLPASVRRALEAAAPFAALRSYQPPARPNAPVLFLIQDLHGAVEAQKNVAALLGRWSAAGPVWVGLEGASGAFDFSSHREIAGPARRTLADYFLSTDSLGGAEAAALAEDAPPVLWGLEAPALYQAHVRALREGLKARAPLQATLSRLSIALEARKEKAYSPALKEYDEAFKAYHAGGSLGVYAQYLLAAAEGAGGYPNLGRLAAALSHEDVLDFRAVEVDRVTLIQRLSDRLPPADLQRLAAESLRLRGGEIGLSAYHAYLLDLCGRNGIAVKDLAAFRAYADYVAGAERIDRAALLTELFQREKDVVDRLARTPAEKATVFLSRDAVLLDKLSRNALTPEEWKDYGARRAELLRFPEAVAPGASRADWAASLAPFEDFCRLASERDAALAENAWARLPQDGVVALVSGGFHTEGMTRFFQAKGAGVAVLTPRISRLPESDYLDLFDKQPLPLEKLFAGEPVFILRERASGNVPGDGAMPRKRAFDRGLTFFSILLRADGEKLTVLPNSLAKAVSRLGFALKAKIERIAGGVRVELSLSTEGGKTSRAVGYALPENAAAPEGEPDETMKVGGLSLFFYARRGVGSFLDKFEEGIQQWAAERLNVPVLKIEAWRLLIPFVLENPFHPKTILIKGSAPILWFAASLGLLLVLGVSGDAGSWVRAVMGVVVGLPSLYMFAWHVGRMFTAERGLYDLGGVIYGMTGLAAFRPVDAWVRSPLPARVDLRWVEGASQGIERMASKTPERMFMDLRAFFPYFPEGMRRFFLKKFLAKRGLQLSEFPWILRSLDSFSPEDVRALFPFLKGHYAVDRPVAEVLSLFSGSLGEESLQDLKDAYEDFFRSPHSRVPGTLTSVVQPSDIAYVVSASVSPVGGEKGPSRAVDFLSRLVDAVMISPVVSGTLSARAISREILDPVIRKVEEKLSSLSPNGLREPIRQIGVALHFSFFPGEEAAAAWAGLLARLAARQGPLGAADALSTWAHRWSVHSSVTHEAMYRAAMELAFSRLDEDPAWAALAAMSVDSYDPPLDPAFSERALAGALSALEEGGGKSAVSLLSALLARRETRVPPAVLDRLWPELMRAARRSRRSAPLDALVLLVSKGASSERQAEFLFLLDDALAGPAAEALRQGLLRADVLPPEFLQGVLRKSPPAVRDVLFWRLGILPPAGENPFFDGANLEKAYDAARIAGELASLPLADTPEADALWDLFLRTFREKLLALNPYGVNDDWSTPPHLILNIMVHGLEKRPRESMKKERMAGFMGVLMEGFRHLGGTPEQLREEYNFPRLVDFSFRAFPGLPGKQEPSIAGELAEMGAVAGSAVERLERVVRLGLGRAVSLDETAYFSRVFEREGGWALLIHLIAWRNVLRRIMARSAAAEEEKAWRTEALFKSLAGGDPISPRVVRQMSSEKALDEAMRYFSWGEYISLVRETDGRVVQGGQLRWDAVERFLLDRPLGTAWAEFDLDSFRRGASLFGAKAVLRYLDRERGVHVFRDQGHKNSVFQHVALFMESLSPQEAALFKKNVFGQVPMDQSLGDDNLDARQRFWRISRILAALPGGWREVLSGMDFQTEALNEVRDELVTRGGAFSSWRQFKKLLLLLNLHQRSTLLASIARLKDNKKPEEGSKLQEYVMELVAHPAVSDIEVVDALIGAMVEGKPDYLDPEDENISEKKAGLKVPSRLLEFPYIDLTARELTRGLALGRLDGVQTFKPFVVEFDARMEKLDGLRSLSVTELLEALKQREGLKGHPAADLDSLKKAVLSAVEDVRGSQPDSPQLRETLQKISAWASVQGIPPSPPRAFRNNRLEPFFRLDALMAKGLRFKGQRHRLELLAKSDPAAASLGNDTPTCMGFGTGKSLEYLFAPTWGHLRLSRLEEDGEEPRWRVLATSILSQDRRAPGKVYPAASVWKETAPDLRAEDLAPGAVFTVDNVESASIMTSGADAEEFKKMVVEGYKRFFDAYVQAHPATPGGRSWESVMSVGLHFSDFLKGFLGTESNDSLPVIPLGYTDKTGKIAGVIRGEGHAEEDPAALADGIRSLLPEDVLEAALLQGRFSDKNILVSLGNELTAAVYNEALKGKTRKNLSLALYKNGRIAAYLVAYRGRVQETGEEVVALTRLVAPDEADRKALLSALGRDIAALARKGASWRIVSEGTVEIEVPGPVAPGAEDLFDFDRGEARVEALEALLKSVARAAGARDDLSIPIDAHVVGSSRYLLRSDSADLDVLLAYDLSGEDPELARFIQPRKVFDAFLEELRKRAGGGWSVGETSPGSGVVALTFLSPDGRQARIDLEASPVTPEAALTVLRSFLDLRRPVDAKNYLQWEYYLGEEDLWRENLRLYRRGELSAEAVARRAAELKARPFVPEEIWRRATRPVSELSAPRAPALALPSTYRVGKAILRLFGSDAPTDRNVELKIAWWWELVTLQVFIPHFAFKHDNAPGELRKRLIGHALILAATAAGFLAPFLAEQGGLVLPVLSAALGNMGVHFLHNLFSSAPLTRRGLFGEEAEDGLLGAVVRAMSEGLDGESPWRVLFDGSPDRRAGLARLAREALPGRRVDAFDFSSAKAVPPGTPAFMEEGEPFEVGAWVKNFRLKAGWSPPRRPPETPTLASSIAVERARLDLSVKDFPAARAAWESLLSDPEDRNAALALVDELSRREELREARVLFTSILEKAWGGTVWGAWNLPVAGMPAILIPDEAPVSLPRSGGMQLDGVVHAGFSPGPDSPFPAVDAVFRILQFGAKRAAEDWLRENASYLEGGEVSAVMPHLGANPLLSLDERHAEGPILDGGLGKTLRLLLEPGAPSAEREEKRLRAALRFLDMLVGLRKAAAWRALRDPAFVRRADALDRFSRQWALLAEAAWDVDVWWEGNTGGERKLSEAPMGALGRDYRDYAADMERRFGEVSRVAAVPVSGFSRRGRPVPSAARPAPPDGASRQVVERHWMDVLFRQEFPAAGDEAPKIVAVESGRAAFRAAAHYTELSGGLEPTGPEMEWLARAVSEGRAPEAAAKFLFRRVQKASGVDGLLDGIVLSPPQAEEALKAYAQGRSLPGAFLLALTLPEAGRPRGADREDPRAESLLERLVSARPSDAPAAAVDVSLQAQRMLDALEREAVDDPLTVRRRVETLRATWESSPVGGAAASLEDSSGTSLEHAAVFRTLLLTWLRDRRWELLPPLFHELRLLAAGPVLRAEDVRLLAEAMLAPELRPRVPSEEGEDLLPFASALTSLFLAGGRQPVDLDSARRFLSKAAEAASPAGSVWVDTLEGGEALALSSWLAEGSGSFSAFGRGLILRKDGRRASMDRDRWIFSWLRILRNSSVEGLRELPIKDLLEKLAAAAPDSAWKGPSSLLDGRYQPLPPEVEDGHLMGGMSQVMRARDLWRDGAPVVVKTAPLQGESSFRGVVLLREAVLMEPFSADPRAGEHIARVRSAGVVSFEGIPHAYLAMDDVGRRTLKDMQDLVAGGRARLGREESLRTAASVYENLAWLHDRGLLHRDVSGHNIVLDDGGLKTRLVDFGFAQPLSAGAAGWRKGQDRLVIGKSSFIAPELVSGKPYSAATDLFAAHVALYRFFAGRHPWTNPGLADRLKEEPEDIRRFCDLPEPLADLIMGGLRADPDQRSPASKSARGALAALEGALSSSGARAPPSDDFEVDVDLHEWETPSSAYGRARFLSSFWAPLLEGLRASGSSVYQAVKRKVNPQLAPMVVTLDDLLDGLGASSPAEKTLDLLSLVASPWALGRSLSMAVYRAAGFPPLDEGGDISPAEVRGHLSFVEQSLRSRGLAVRFGVLSGRGGEEGLTALPDGPDGIYIPIPPAEWAKFAALDDLSLRAALFRLGVHEFAEFLGKWGSFEQRLPHAVLESRGVSLWGARAPLPGADLEVYMDGFLAKARALAMREAGVPTVQGWLERHEEVLRRCFGDRAGFFVNDLKLLEAGEEDRSRSVVAALHVIDVFCERQALSQGAAEGPFRVRLQAAAEDLARLAGASVDGKILWRDVLLGEPVPVDGSVVVDESFGLEAGTSADVPAVGKVLQSGVLFRNGRVSPARVRTEESFVAHAIADRLLLERAVDAGSPEREAKILSEQLRESQVFAYHLWVDQTSQRIARRVRWKSVSTNFANQVLSLLEDGVLDRAGRVLELLRTWEMRPDAGEETRRTAALLFQELSRMALELGFAGAPTRPKLPKPAPAGRGWGLFRASTRELVALDGVLQPGQRGEVGRMMSSDLYLKVPFIPSRGDGPVSAFGEGFLFRFLLPAFRVVPSLDLLSLSAKGLPSHRGREVFSWAFPLWADLFSGDPAREEDSLRRLSGLVFPTRGGFRRFKALLRLLGLRLGRLPAARQAALDRAARALAGQKIPVRPLVMSGSFLDREDVGDAVVSFLSPAGVLVLVGERDLDAFLREEDPEAALARLMVHEWAEAVLRLPHRDVSAGGLDAGRDGMPRRAGESLDDYAARLKGRALGLRRLKREASRRAPARPEMAPGDAAAAWFRRHAHLLESLFGKDVVDSRMVETLGALRNAAAGRAADDLDLAFLFFQELSTIRDSSLFHHPLRPRLARAMDEMEEVLNASLGGRLRWTDTLVGRPAEAGFREARGEIIAGLPSPTGSRVVEVRRPGFRFKDGGGVEPEVVLGPPVLADLALARLRLRRAVDGEADPAVLAELREEYRRAQLPAFRFLSDLLWRRAMSAVSAMGSRDLSHDFSIFRQLFSHVGDLRSVLAALDAMWDWHSFRARSGPGGTLSTGLLRSLSEAVGFAWDGKVYDRAVLEGTSTRDLPAGAAVPKDGAVASFIVGRVFRSGFRAFLPELLGPGFPAVVGPSEEEAPYLKGMSGRSFFLSPDGARYVSRLRVVMDGDRLVSVGDYIAPGYGPRGAVERGINEGRYSFDFKEMSFSSSPDASTLTLLPPASSRRVERLFPSRWGEEPLRVYMPGQLADASQNPAARVILQALEGLGYPARRVDWLGTGREGPLPHLLVTVLGPLAVLEVLSPGERDPLSFDLLDPAAAWEVEAYLRPFVPGFLPGLVSAYGEEVLDAWWSEVRDRAVRRVGRSALAAAEGSGWGATARAALSVVDARPPSLIALMEAVLRAALVAVDASPAHPLSGVLREVESLLLSRHGLRVRFHLMEGAPLAGGDRPMIFARHDAERGELSVTLDPSAAVAATDDARDFLIRLAAHELARVYGRVPHDELERSLPAVGAGAPRRSAAEALELYADRLVDLARRVSGNRWRGAPAPLPSAPVAASAERALALLSEARRSADPLPGPGFAPIRRRLSGQARALREASSEAAKRRLLGEMADLLLSMGFLSVGTREVLDRAASRDAQAFVRLLTELAAGAETLLSARATLEEALSLAGDETSAGWRLVRAARKAGLSTHARAPLFVLDAERAAPPRGLLAPESRRFEGLRQAELLEEARLLRTLRGPAVPAAAPVSAAAAGTPGLVVAQRALDARRKDVLGEALRAAEAAALRAKPLARRLEELVDRGETAQAQSLFDDWMALGRPGAPALLREARPDAAAAMTAHLPAEEAARLLALSAGEAAPGAFDDAVHGRLAGVMDRMGDDRAAAVLEGLLDRDQILAERILFTLKESPSLSLIHALMTVVTRDWEVGEENLYLARVIQSDAPVPLAEFYRVPSAGRAVLPRLKAWGRGLLSRRPDPLAQRRADILDRLLDFQTEASRLGPDREKARLAALQFASDKLLGLSADEVIKKILNGKDILSPFADLLGHGPPLERREDLDLFRMKVAGQLLSLQHPLAGASFAAGLLARGGSRESPEWRSFLTALFADKAAEMMLAFLAEPAWEALRPRLRQAARFNRGWSDLFWTRLLERNAARGEASLPIVPHEDFLRHGFFLQSDRLKDLVRIVAEERANIHTDSAQGSEPQNVLRRMEGLEYLLRAVKGGSISVEQKDRRGTRRAVSEQYFLSLALHHFTEEDLWVIRDRWDSFPEALRFLLERGDFVSSIFRNGRGGRTLTFHDGVEAFRLLDDTPLLVRLLKSFEPDSEEDARLLKEAAVSHYRRTRDEKLLEAMVSKQALLPLLADSYRESMDDEIVDKIIARRDPAAAAALLSWLPTHHPSELFGRFVKSGAPADLKRAVHAARAAQVIVDAQPAEGRQRSQSELDALAEAGMRHFLSGLAARAAEPWGPRDRLLFHGLHVWMGWSGNRPHFHMGRFSGLIDAAVSSQRRMVERFRASGDLLVAVDLVLADRFGAPNHLAVPHIPGVAETRESVYSALPLDGWPRDLELDPAHALYPGSFRRARVSEDKSAVRRINVANPSNAPAVLSYSFYDAAGVWKAAASATGPGQDRSKDHLLPPALSLLQALAPWLSAHFRRVPPWVWTGLLALVISPLWEEGLFRFILSDAFHVPTGVVALLFTVPHYWSNKAAAEAAFSAWAAGRLPKDLSSAEREKERRRFVRGSMAWRFAFQFAGSLFLDACFSPLRPWWDTVLRHSALNLFLMLGSLVVGQGEGREVPAPLLSIWKGPSARGPDDAFDRALRGPAAAAARRAREEARLAGRPVVVHVTELFREPADPREAAAQRALAALVRALPAAEEGEAPAPSVHFLVKDSSVSAARARALLPTGTLHLAAEDAALYPDGFISEKALKARVSPRASGPVALHLLDAEDLLLDDGGRSVTVGLLLPELVRAARRIQESLQSLAAVLRAA